MFTFLALARAGGPAKGGLLQGADNGPPETWANRV